jgi:hypothetical protein
MPAVSIALSRQSSSRRSMQNQTIGQVQPIGYTPQLAMDGMAI